MKKMNKPKLEIIVKVKVKQNHPSVGRANVLNDQSISEVKQ